MSYTAQEKLAEVERELAMRERVYPRWVRDGKLKPEESDRRIAILEAVAADYRSDIEMAERQGRLL